MSIPVPFRLVTIAILVLIAVVTLFAGRAAWTTLAEGFGWGGAVRAPAPTEVVAEGFGWPAPAPVTPGSP
jgi:hypothetical protein